MQRKNDNPQWILRTTRDILKASGPRAARRFLENRGGTAKWQAAAREIARSATERKETSIPSDPRYGSLSRDGCLG